MAKRESLHDAVAEFREKHKPVRTTTWELQFNFRNLWIGIYWETHPKPYRKDLFICFFLFAIHIVTKEGI